MKLEGGLQFSADVKEALVAEMEEQRRAAGIEVAPARIERIERRGGELLLHKDDKTTIAARRAIVAIGRSGNFRKLGVPGEELDKVYNRLFDPKEFAGQNALVVGGGDSALETAIALADLRRARHAQLSPQGIGAGEAGEHRESRDARARRVGRCADRETDLRTGQHGA